MTRPGPGSLERGAALVLAPLGCHISEMKRQVGGELG